MRRLCAPIIFRCMRGVDECHCRRVAFFALGRSVRFAHHVYSAHATRIVGNKSRRVCAIDRAVAKSRVCVHAVHHSSQPKRHSIGLSDACTHTNTQTIIMRKLFDGCRKRSLAIASTHRRHQNAMRNWRAPKKRRAGGAQG